MDISKRIARILGPVLAVLAVTEGLNIRVFAGNPAQVVFLNGTLLFAAGVAILQAHARWSWSLATLVTVAGWFLLIGGLYRMIAPTAPQLAEGAATWAVLAMLGLTGALLTLKGYGPPNQPLAVERVRPPPP